MKNTAKAQPAAPEQQPAKNYMQYLLNIWVLLPAVLLFKTINEYAVNIPYVDDYPVILKFLSDYKKAGFSEKIALFFTQNNEHRLAYSKLIYLLYYKLCGDVNFFNLIIINNLHWLGTFLVMAYFIKKYLPQRWNIAAFITALSMFDLNNYENSNAAMFGMQNYGLVLFFLLSMFFYEKANRKFLGAAIACQVICIFSSGGGMLVCVSLLLYTILQKDRINIITCALTSLIFCGLYFVHYVKPPSSQGPFDMAVAVPFFFHQVGAHFAYENGVTYGVLTLIALLVVLPVTKKLAIPPAARPFIAILAFVMGSMLATAVFRSTPNMLMSYSSRYFIYPHLLVAIIFIFMLAKVEGKKIQWPLTVGFMLLMLYTYKANYDYGVAGFEREQYRLIYSEYYWPFPDKDTPKNIAIQACTDDIYCIQNERAVP